MVLDDDGGNADSDSTSNCSNSDNSRHRWRSDIRAQAKASMPISSTLHHSVNTVVLTKVCHMKEGCRHLLWSFEDQHSSHLNNDWLVIVVIVVVAAAVCCELQ